MKLSTITTIILPLLSSLALATDIDVSHKEVEVVINVFLVGSSSYYYYDASVIAADSSATTLTLGLPQSEVDYYATAYDDDYYGDYTYATPTITITQGDSFMVAQVTDAPYTTHLSCDITGTTEATCHETMMSASRNGEGAYTRISETTYGEEDVEEGFYPVTITAGVDKVLAAESAQTETRFTLTGLPTLAPTQNTDGQSEPTTNVPVAPTPTSTGAAAAVTFVQGGMVAGVAAAMAALAL